MKTLRMGGKWGVGGGGVGSRGRQISSALSAHVARTSVAAESIRRSSLLTELSDAATRLRLHPPSAPRPEGARAEPLCEARIDALSLRPSIARRSHTYGALTLQATQDRDAQPSEGRGRQTGGPDRRQADGQTGARQEAGRQEGAWKLGGRTSLPTRYDESDWLDCGEDVRGDQAGRDGAACRGGRGARRGAQRPGARTCVRGGGGPISPWMSGSSSGA